MLNKKNFTKIILAFMLSFIILTLNGKSNAKVLNENENNIEIIKNGKFEEIDANTSNWKEIKPKDWNLWIPSNIQNDDYTAKVTQDNKLYISSQKQFRAIVNQTLNIEKGKKYVLKLDLETIDKMGFAQVLINENIKGKNKILIENSRLTKTSDKPKNIVFNYEALEDIDNIKVEIEFGLGTGTLIADNVSFVEVEKFPEDEIIEENDQNNNDKEEVDISLPLNKKFLVKDINSKYNIVNSKIAKIEDNYIIPLEEGETEIKIQSDAKEEKSIKLKVLKEEINKYSDKILLWEESIIANKEYDDNNPFMKKLKDKLDEEVREILSLKYDGKDNKKFWTDIENYKVSSSLTKSYRRIESLAKQVNQPKSAYYKSYEATKMIIDAMEWLYKNHYNESTIIEGNWWDYEIGTPRAINNILTLMWDYFTQEQIDKYTKPITILVPDPTKFRVTLGNPFDALGGNLTDMGRVKIISSLLRQEDQTLNETIKALKNLYVQRENKIDKPCVPGSCEGFYKDGSYVDHTDVAYTGAYGNVVIDALSQLFPIIEDQTDKEDLLTLYDIIDKSFRPIIYKGELMDMVRGRSISREALQSHVAAGEVVRGVLRIANATVDNNQKYKLLSQLKTWLDSDYYEIENSMVTYKDLSMIKELKESQNIEKNAENSLDIFTNMNKLVYKNAKKDFALGISMISDTIKSYEFMNGENAKGWYTSDGAVYLYNSDSSHYSDDYWPTVDSYKIPGTTELTISRNEDPNRGNNNPESYEVLLKSSFSGATKLDEKYASASMDFNNFNNMLKIKKAWFIFDDKIVFLGSGLENISQEDAITTIENRKIAKNDEYKILVDGSEFSDLQDEEVSKILLLNSDTNKNIGYHFLGKEKVNLEINNREGKWAEIKSGASDELRSNRFITLTKNHSEKKDYSYVMYPNIDKKEFETINEDSIIVLNNDQDIQAVKDVKNNALGVVIHNDAASFKVDENLTLSDKGIYMIKLEDDIYKISIFNPDTQTFNENSITSKLDKSIIKFSDFADFSTIIELKKQELEDNNKDKGKESIENKDKHSDSSYNKNDNNSSENEKSKGEIKIINQNKAKNDSKIDEQNIKNKDINNPNTSDSGIMIYSLVCCISIMIIFVMRKRKLD